MGSYINLKNKVIIEKKTELKRCKNKQGKVKGEKMQIDYSGNKTGSG